MDTVFLEEHACSHTFWVVPSLFQEATCSDLVFSRVLCFFETSTCSDPFFKGIELIRNSSCSHPFHERPFFCYKKANAATHIFKFTEFLQDRNCSMKIFIRPWFQVYILKEICYLMTSIPVIHFFYGSIIISRKQLKPSKQSVVDSTKLKGYVYFRKVIAVLLF